MSLALHVCPPAFFRVPVYYHLQPIMAAKNQRQLGAELTGLFDEYNVQQDFRDCLAVNGVVTIQKFAVAAYSEDHIDTDIIQPSGCAFTFGGKTSLKVACLAARRIGGSASIASSYNGQTSSGKHVRMLEGIEEALHKAWQSLHRLHLN